MVNYTDIKHAILTSLSPDLLEPQYRAQLQEGDAPETGHCAIASEAFYHLAGGRLAGYMPVVCGYYADADGNPQHDYKPAPGAQPQRQTHWWIRGPKNGQRGQGRIFDVTAGQYDGPFDYNRGHNTGFMQPQQKPSRRAQAVIDRVAEKLGAEALEEYRLKNIRVFQTAEKKQQMAAMIKRPVC